MIHTSHSTALHRQFQRAKIQLHFRQHCYFLFKRHPPCVPPARTLAITVPVGARRSLHIPEQLTAPVLSSVPVASTRVPYLAALPTRLMTRGCRSYIYLIFYTSHLYHCFASRTLLYCDLLLSSFSPFLPSGFAKSESLQEKGWVF